MRRYLTALSIILLILSAFAAHKLSRARAREVPLPRTAAAVKPVKAAAEAVEPPRPLKNPPGAIKAVYLTSWSASSARKVDQTIGLIKATELNAVVIDLKDYSGYVIYDIEIPEVKKYGARERRIRDINGLVRKFHDEGIYVIGRISVFQDPVLAKAEPASAVHSASRVRALGRASNDTVWVDDKGLSWVDPASRLAWDYNIAIARDAASRGFDELNFDYIRFPSDGRLGDMHFPRWDRKTPKREVIKSFFKHLRTELKGVRISADLFGLTTVKRDDLEIGQVIEDAYEFFDYVCPMVYPSHFANGFLGYRNPAKYPYEVVKYSMGDAAKRLEASGGAAKLRPWLQDFDLGADYNAQMVRGQIMAVYGASERKELMNGWMFWDPRNTYTSEAFLHQKAED